MIYLLGSDHMNPFINENIDSKLAKFYDKHYTVLNWHLLNDKEYIYLGNEKTKACRFCGKDESNGATFEKLAHAFPESIGNRCLATYYECDKCNERFGKTIENDFANFMKFYHSISGIHGKKKIPEFISNDNKSKSAWVDDEYILSDTNENLHSSIKNNSILYQATAPTHTPMAVYKCFVKMAISVMPENELKPFAKTIEWICNKKHENIFGNKKLLCRYEMIPGYNTTKHPCYVLYKRKGHNSLAIYPYMIFNLTYGNFSYMIEIPTQEDLLQSIDKIKFPPIPFKSSSTGILNLTSNKSVSDLQQTMLWNFDSIKEISIDDLPEKIKNTALIKK